MRDATSTNLVLGIGIADVGSRIPVSGFRFPDFGRFAGSSCAKASAFSRMRDMADKMEDWGSLT
jgi:hypothetical protein